VDESESVETVVHDLHAAHANYALVYADAALLGVVDVPSLLRYLLSPRPTDAPIGRVLQRCAVLPATAPIDAVLHELCRGIVRCAVVTTADGHTLTSQRALVQHVLDTELRPDLLTCSLRDLSMGSSRPIVNCTNRFEANEAFLLMAAYDVTSLPVVDDEGQLCGVIAASDILYARTETRDRLSLNVLEYVARSRADRGTMRPVNLVLTCTADDSLQTVLDTMLRECVHHVYVKDEEGFVHDVVSFVDVLRRMMHN
jgi:CBS domain-containing protein